MWDVEFRLDRHVGTVFELALHCLTDSTACAGAAQARKSPPRLLQNATGQPHNFQTVRDS
jgi:hypothetical protein